jgi:hypothetical protein
MPPNKVGRKDILYHSVISNLIGNRNALVWYGVKLFKISACAYRVDTSFGLVFLYVLLACFNKLQVLPKNAVNRKGQENQKNRSCSLQLALTNLKRSGFVFVISELKLKKAFEHKTKCRCFFDVREIV